MVRRGKIRKKVNSVSSYWSLILKNSGSIWFNTVLLIEDGIIWFWSGWNDASLINLGPLQVIHGTFISKWANRTAVLEVSKYMTRMFLGLSPRLSFPAHQSVWIWFHFSHFLFSMTATLVIFLEIFLVKIAEKNLVGTKGLFVIVKWVRREREWARRIGTSIALVYYLRQTAALLKKKRKRKLCHRHLSPWKCQISCRGGPLQLLGLYSRFPSALQKFE